MFEHVRRWFPWYERARRKADFIKKLQAPGHGKPKIRFKNISKIPAGVMLLLQDYSDGTMLNAIYTGSGDWMVYGNGPLLNISGRPKMMTSMEFEDFLTEKRNMATGKDKLLIMDESQLLNIDYKKAHVANAMGFSKMAWHDIGNNEEE